MDNFERMRAASQPPQKVAQKEKFVDATNEVAKQERERELNRPRTRGFVIRCDGEHAVVAAAVDEISEDKENFWAVGQLVSVRVGMNRVVGLICNVDVPSSSWNTSQANQIEITLELVGEIASTTEGEADVFSNGITRYPQMGCVAHRIRAADLAIIYRSEGNSIVEIGNLTQDKSVAAKIDVDKLLSRHFAIVGTTGVGKSTSVTLMLRKIVNVRPEIRVLILDPHNEFACAFPDNSCIIGAQNLNLPFWLFKLDEFVEVVFRGQPGFEAEVEVLRELIPQAKEHYRNDAGKKSSPLKRKSSNSNITADMPLPYRLLDLIRLIDDRLGQLDGKADKPMLKSLRNRLDVIMRDPRFRFMFDGAVGGDVMEQVMADIFRIPQSGKPICVLEMSGLPSEVVSSVVSVLCRMAFDLAMNSEGGIQTLVVCEEAHRYIPADQNAGFWPTRQAIARIAKEGRKYGVYLGIITQRPGELDPTILSQCNTLFAMRLGNEKDQDIVRGAVTNGAKSTIGFLPSISNRECIAFGEAISTPMRMTFETIPDRDLPGARIYEQHRKVRQGHDISLGAVLRRMRQEDRRELAMADLGPEEVDFGLDSDHPAEEINSIMNAVYVPQQKQPAAPLQPPVPGVPVGQGIAPAGGSVHARPEPKRPPAQPRPTAPAPGGQGANNLIRSFRNS